MINWDDFEHIHVIKKLKHILHAWWNIDIVFTDERGHLKGFEGEKISYANPAVNYLVNKESTQNSLAELVANSIQDLRQSQNRYLIKKWDAAGFDVCVFPIIIENDFVGTVVAMGFFKDAQIAARVSEVRERLAAFGCTNELIEKAVSKFQYVDDSSRQHFCELVELVAQEIVTLHVEISSRENKITELNKELGNRFKYDNMMGKSKPMQSLYALMDKIKFADSTVMVQGENGTGKELIAKSIHYNSHR